MLDILEKIRTLDPYEQLKIVDTVWNDLSQPTLGEDDADFDEMERRFQDHLKDPSSSIPAEIFLAELKAKYNY